ncbi:MAG: signal peptidase I [Candidatus Omnitrophica bacterium]|nr:signal peptidase I [Candidatus Omnitrophota bacterium]MCM8771390.1 signal peptidase I [Candidatus Omnitrophota bacterium]
MKSNIKKKSVIRDWIESIIIALILALFIRTFIVQAFKIPTGSMRMTLLEGDRILVNKFIYGAKIPFTNFRLPALRDIKRGDVIVFISPEDTRKDFIKRVVGLPGEKVQIKDLRVYINGRPLEEGGFAHRNYYNRGEFGEEGKVIEVPKDAYYVLGDNSFSSRDSRYWGFVPKKYVLGKAFLIYWPLTRLRIIQ